MGCAASSGIAGATAAHPRNKVAPEDTPVPAAQGGDALAAPTDLSDIEDEPDPPAGLDDDGDDGDEDTTASAPAEAEALPAVALIGISLRGIRRLRVHLEQLCASPESPFRHHAKLLDQEYPGVDSFKQLSTTQLVHQWVKMEKVTATHRLAEIPHLVDPADIGPPSYFISHAWKSTVSKLFDTIEAFLVDASDNTRVWLDFVAINQHEEFAQSKEDVSAFEACLKQCAAGTIVVVDQQRCNPATRGWCVYEWDHTLLHHGPDGLHMRGMGLEDMDAIINCINSGADTTKCQRPEDLEMIRGKILEHHHSFEEFDRRLKLHLLLDPLSYKVDLEQLVRRSAGGDSKWRWDPVRRFLAQQPEEGRVLCFLAGAGTGKSSISANLIQRVLGRQHRKSGAWLGPATAMHFVKHNDQRRLDPVRMVKSLAYQLAVRLPRAAKALLRLSPKAVAELRRPEDALQQLLLPVLSRTRKPVVLLIDALDEADPIEEQRPDFDSTKATVKACGNAVLSFLVGQLAQQMPAHVKLILTTRPESCCNGVQAVLSRAFPDGVTFLRPDQVRADSADGQAVVSNADASGGQAAASTTDADGGQAAAPNADADGGQAAAHTANADGSQAAVSNADAGGDQAVVSNGDAGGGQAAASNADTDGSQAAVSNADAGGDQAVVSSADAGGGQAAASNADAGGGQAAASKVLVYDAVVRECGLSDLPQLPEGGATLDHLRTAYHSVFERSPPQGPTALLVQLLITAQEPLSASLLQRLGIGAAELADLPGWGCLFFEAEHRVYLLHKSLSDWLMLPTERNPFAPDVHAGHEALGTRLAKDALRASETVQPSDYCLKYAVHHLCHAGPDCAHLLDQVLANWDFLRAGIKAGHGGKLLAVLGAAALNKRNGLNEYSRDAFLWLSRFHSDFQADPDAMERITAHDPRCPISCLKFKEAVSRMRLPWAPRFQLGGYGNDWPPDISTLKGHTGPVQAVSLSSDGRQLATCSGDHTVKVWDLATGICTATFQGHSTDIFYVAFRPGGRQLATCSQDCSVRLWDLASGSCSNVLLCTEYDAEGTLTISGTCHMAFSPDGSQLAWGCSISGAVFVWVFADNAATTVATTQALGSHTETVTAVAFRPDGAQLATGSSDTTVKVWDLATSACITTLEPAEHVTVTVFSPDGKLLAVGCDIETALVYDLATGACVWRMSSRIVYVAVVFSRDNVKSMAFSPDGRHLALGSTVTGASVRQLDAEVPNPPCVFLLESHTAAVNSVVFSHDGRQLITGSSDATAKVWDLASTARRGTLQGHTQSLACVAFSADGTLLATCSDDKDAKIWDLATGTCTATLSGHYMQVWVVGFSPDGKLLATGSSDRTAKVWDVATGDCVITLDPECQVHGVAFSADSKQLTTRSALLFASKETIKVWDLASGKCTSTDTDYMRKDKTNAPSPDGKLEARVSYSDAKDVVVWDLASNTITATLKGHEGEVSTIAFSPDGKQLATGSRDGTAKVWDLVGSP